MAVPYETPYGPREAVADWLRANGIDPSDVPIEGPITTTRDRIHYAALLRDGAGRRYVDRATGGAARAPRWAVLKLKPPPTVRAPALPGTE